MSLQELTREVFAPAGLLSRSVPEFRLRPGQTSMALAIAQVITDGGVLVVEAGTGIGKTFAYLVPALLSGQRLLLSTATKTLQDQLFGRDLPKLIQALGLPTRVALLKGRSSYLCLQRLAQARQNLGSHEHLTARFLSQIERWAQRTRSGDLAELEGLDERSTLPGLVTSSRENCLGTQCPQARECHVNQARREAMAADVVVINHHLFFADLALRESGLAELLPEVQSVIFDEAHQLNETGVQFLGQQLSSGQLLDFARDLLALATQHARGLCDWPQLASAIEKTTRDLRLLVGHNHRAGKLRWLSLAPEQIDADTWSAAVLALLSALEQAGVGLASVAESHADLQRLSERVTELTRALGVFTQPCASESVRWLDISQQLRLVESPLDIADVVQERLLAAPAPPGSQRSFVFTSATLGDAADLRWFTEPCGLSGAPSLRLGSPFDYATQAALYVPADLARPGSDEHSAQVAELVARSASVIGGHTLVLTTSIRALLLVSAALQRHFADTKQLEILVQGQQTKRQLMQRFRQGDGPGGPACILVASASFWEGVDIPGDALQLLVIDKLPFPPPTDPLVEARAKRLQALGRSVFNDYYLPEAAIALKQGAGRLIRRESDRGILLLCDPRLDAMAYGRRLLRSLPPMRRLGSADEFNQALQSLTRTSTMDLCPL